ncbi:hypothetical protein [Nostoc sp.]|uniref:hypothetical protein n=1 Tax=Nostoc sp. TaxID=1180 RepID=UPI002FF9C280
MTKTKSGDSFYFIYTGSTKIELAANKKLIFVLENISAEPGGGSRGTRVELKYTNITCFNNSISGTQLQYLNIVNQLGSRQIPLAVNFVGSPKEIVSVDFAPQSTPEGKSINSTDNTQNQNPESNSTQLNVVGSNRILNDGTSNELIIAFHYLDYLRDPADKKTVGLSLRGSENNKDKIFILYFY